MSPPGPPTAESPVAEPVLPPTDVPSDSGSTSTAVDEPSDSDSDSDTSTGSDSPAPRPQKKQRRGRHVLQPAKTPPTAAVDFLHPRRVPLKSSQPTPPRRLKLPTVASDTLRRLRNRTKVVDVDELLHPCPIGGRGGPTGPAHRAASSAEYMKGVAILVAYRAYFFPPLAVQWALYQVWLQGLAVGLSLSSLRALDSQGRTHLAQYPRDYHSPAALTESVRGTAASSDAIRSPSTSAPRPPPAIASAGRLPTRPYHEMEPCFRWNSGHCNNGLLCRRAHACITCGGPHPVRACRPAGNGPRPLARPPAGRY